MLPFSFLGWYFFWKRSIKYRKQHSSQPLHLRARVIFSRFSRYVRRLGYKIEFRNFPLQISRKPVIFFMMHDSKLDYFVTSSFQPFSEKAEDTIQTRVPVFGLTLPPKSLILKSLVVLTDSFTFLSPHKKPDLIKNFVTLLKEKERYGVFLITSSNKEEFLLVLKQAQNFLLNIVGVKKTIENKPKGFLGFKRIKLEFSSPVTQSELLQSDLNQVKLKLMSKLLD